MKQIKDKVCKNCRLKFKPFNSLQVVCSPKCALIVSKVKKQLSDTKEWNKEKKALKEQLKTLSQYEIEAKKSFQKWIRLRDKDLPCISCDKKTNDPAGGHFYSAGMYSGLMFNEMNCHLQCNTYCNKYLSGNLLEYRKGLINRYGASYVETLDNIADENRNYKYTKEELIAKKLKYDILIKEFD